jgi:hypothetical protein
MYSSHQLICCSSKKYDEAMPLMFALFADMPGFSSGPSDTNVGV